MATSELSHFCSFVGLCHLQSSWWIKLKPWKPCPPLFGSTVISMTGWQAKDINLNWHSWNYALQTGECSFMTLLQEMITCNYRNRKKGVFREQSSLISGQKEREEWWLEGHAMSLVMRTALFKSTAIVSVALRSQHPIPSQPSDMGFHQQFIYLKSPSHSGITLPTLK